MSKMRSGDDLLSGFMFQSPKLQQLQEKAYALKLPAGPTSRDKECTRYCSSSSQSQLVSEYRHCTQLIKRCGVILVLETLYILPTGGPTNRAVLLKISNLNNEFRQTLQENAGKPSWCEPDVRGIAPNLGLKHRPQGW
jgi:hypothetical protein